MKLQIFYDLILILVSTKLLGLLMRKIHVPEVVGALLAGVLLGPTVFGVIKQSDMLDVFAELGVVMIMFTAGTETNLKQIKASGKASTIITLFGVFVPLIGGYVVASLFNGGFGGSFEHTVSNMFYGVLLTATSVTITVATLKELGRLQTKVGTSILSAAVLDDIIGIIILTVFTGMKNPEVSPVKMTIRILIFFALTIVLGYFIRKVYVKMESWAPETRRNIIFAFVVCLCFSYCAEKFFGLADITGAFFAGIIFSDLKESKRLEHRLDITSYLVFSPVFFASIGINTQLAGFDKSMLAFGICFVIIGLATKFLGAGIMGSKLCGYSTKDSVRVGLGMMCRAEVILVTAQKGIQIGFIDDKFMPFVILLVIISSFITPIFLKMTYKGELAPAPIGD